ncbi:MAG: hypothetical protein KKH88_03925 [Nanoarchaeota archaeon]|nr:hypothetical protein [Nanoarchaeota archaeon]
MSTTEQIMVKALKTNLVHKKGEKVVIVTQEFDSKFENNLKPQFDRALELCKKLNETYQNQGINSTLITFTPKDAGSGINPTKELYNKFEEFEKNSGIPEIVIAPSAYSLTHTAWRKQQCEKGSRIATMSNSSLAMFQPGGPFDIEEDYNKILEETKEKAEKLRNSKYVKITGPNTELVINVDQNLVIESTGILSKPGTYGNWLGAEAFAVPIHLGDSYGYFLTPKNWGGAKQLKYSAIFHIKDGKFTDIKSADNSKEAQSWLDENIKPMIFNKPNNDVVAELGLGTNPFVRDDYLMKNWSLAVAEKKGNTVHIAHGNSKCMGGQNDVEIHQDFVILNVDKIEFNYRP